MLGRRGTLFLFTRWCCALIRPTVSLSPPPPRVIERTTKSIVTLLCILFLLSFYISPFLLMMRHTKWWYYDEHFRQFYCTCVCRIGENNLFSASSRTRRKFKTHLSEHAHCVCVLCNYMMSKRCGRESVFYDIKRRRCYYKLLFIYTAYDNPNDLYDFNAARLSKYVLYAKTRISRRTTRRH